MDLARKLSASNPPSKGYSPISTAEKKTTPPKLGAPASRAHSDSATSFKLPPNITIENVEPGRSAHRGKSTSGRAVPSTHFLKRFPQASPLEERRSAGKLEQVEPTKLHNDDGEDGSAGKGKGKREEEKGKRRGEKDRKSSDTPSSDEIAVIDIDEDVMSDYLSSRTSGPKTEVEAGSVTSLRETNNIVIKPKKEDGPAVGLSVNRLLRPEPTYSLSPSAEGAPTGRVNAVLSDVPFSHFTAPPTTGSKSIVMKKEVRCGGGDVVRSMGLEK